MHITARDGAGLFYGAITAWQLLTADSNQGPTEIPTVTIHDWPRFKWRGQLLDVARHFHDVDTVKHVIDAMAQHKLNVLHLHLTDDQGWRIEIKRYPKLTAIGAERIPPGAGRHGTPERYGGFYTQDQIRELVAYATERQITILPKSTCPAMHKPPWQPTPTSSGHQHHPTRQRRLGRQPLPLRHQHTQPGLHPQCTRRSTHPIPLPVHPHRRRRSR